MTTHQGRWIGICNRILTPCIRASVLLILPVAAQEETPTKSTDEYAGKPVMDPRHVHGMMNKRLENAPKLGEHAPGGSILTDAVSGNSVSLLDLYKEKPVVLFFASYSCLSAHEGANEMSRLAKQFGEIADFILIYIREAHPRNGFLPPERGNRFIIDAPVSLAERSANALRYAHEQELNFRVLVDSMDDSTAVRWGAWPIRAFVISRSGIVNYAGQQGPWYFHPSIAFEHNLENAPSGLANIPGFSDDSLEEFLEELEQLSDSP